MNGKKAKLFRKQARFVVDKETSYQSKEVPVGRKALRLRLTAYKLGFIEDVNILGLPSKITQLSSECTRSFYKALKKGIVHA